MVLCCAVQIQLGFDRIHASAGVESQMLLAAGVVSTVEVYGMPVIQLHWNWSSLDTKHE